MTRLFHRASRLSMLMLGLAAPLAVPAAAGAAAATSSPYYGRWTVSEDRPVFTTRGRQYKTIDIAACGNDFCGVSVSEAGACGPTLFRFLSRNAHGESALHGHGRWGQVKKNVQITTWPDQDSPGGKVIEVYLGDGYDFGERSDNMPKFHAMYRPAGAARCRAR
jgi:hypothetical protein